MFFDIIIPTYNNLNELKACLNGFSTQTHKNFKIIICIDGSTDGTQEFLSSTTYPFTFIFFNHPDKGNHGRNATRNLAIPHLESDYLLLLDSDAIPAPDLLEQHLACLNKGDIVSVGIIHYLNSEENLWAQYTETRGRYRLSDGIPIRYHLFNSGNVAFKTDYFIALGGQDPEMAHYGGGDTDFAVRLFDRFKVTFINNKKATATSIMNKDLQYALDQMVEFGKFNLQYLFQKHARHRQLYGMDIMKRYQLFFRLLTFKPMQDLAKTAIPFSPKKLQNMLIRYLVIANLFSGFSS